MKRCMIIMVVLLVMPCVGCNSGSTRKATREFNSLATRYSGLKKAGRTSAVQDAAYIHMTAEYAFAIDRAIRGTKRATRTRNEARMEPIRAEIVDMEPLTGSTGSRQVIRADVEPSSGTSR